MRLTPWTTTSLAIVGNDLAVARLRGSVRGVRVERCELIRSFLSLSPAERRGALAPFGAGNPDVLLTIPADWSALRPLALSVSSWGAARDEILGSIESLFPLSRNDAMVGLIERSGAADPGSSYLVAADSARLQPWREAIVEAIGSPVSRILSAQMAMLGMGLQSSAQATIAEQTPAGGRLSHRLSHGRVVELAVPADREEPVDAGLPGSDSDERAPVDLAIGAALAPLVAPGSFVPLEGRPFKTPNRWAVPASAIAASVALVIGASFVLDSRYEAESERLRSGGEAMQAVLAEVQSDRAFVRQTSSLLDQTVRPVVEGWRSVLPDLVAAQGALPDDGFLYRIELDESAVTIKGEAGRASEVLTALERSPVFAGARSLDASFAVEERQSEQFHVQASREAHLRAGEDAR